ncbi:MAG TPA: hypothetical protein VGS11_07625 [Candidatus Bathyarchaeia archaeon]|nr:hypothetical protein [Candidatus Bathyarchaeia archaeon]
MPTPEHNNVVNALDQALRESGYEVSHGTALPFPSVLERFGHRRLMPDLWANKKGIKQYDVYQVWDSEGSGDAISEVMRAELTPNVGSLSIVLVENERLARKNDNWTLSYTRNYVKGVLEVLDHSRLSFPWNEFYFAEVSSAMAKDLVKTKQYLKQKLGI